MEIGGIAPLFLALSFTIGKETRYTEEKAVEKEKKSLPLSRFELWTVQPVAQIHNSSLSKRRILCLKQK
jgi:hypothetical protein